MQIPKQLSESGRKCLGFAETVNCGLVILLEPKGNEKEKMVLKIIRGKKIQIVEGNGLRVTR